jgi:hypothetical protein
VTWNDSAGAFLHRPVIEAVECRHRRGGLTRDPGSCARVGAFMVQPATHAAVDVTAMGIRRGAESHAAWVVRAAVVGEGVASELPDPSEPRVDRLRLEREDGEDGLVHLPQRFVVDESGQCLQAESVLALGELALLAEVAIAEYVE